MQKKEPRVRESRLSQIKRGVQNLQSALARDDDSHQWSFEEIRVKLLLLKEDNPHLIEGNLLHYLARSPGRHVPGVLKRCLDSGFDPNAFGSFRRPPLSSFWENPLQDLVKRKEILELFLTHDASPSFVTAKGETFLTRPIRQNDLESLNMVFSLCSPRIFAEDLQECCALGDPHLLSVVLDRVGKHEWAFPRPVDVDGASPRHSDRGKRSALRRLGDKVKRERSKHSRRRRMREQNQGKGKEFVDESSEILESDSFDSRSEPSHDSVLVESDGSSDEYGISEDDLEEFDFCEAKSSAEVDRDIFLEFIDCGEDSFTLLQTILLAIRIGIPPGMGAGNPRVFDARPQLLRQFESPSDGDRMECIRLVLNAIVSTSSSEAAAMERLRSFLSMQDCLLRTVYHYAAAVDCYHTTQRGGEQTKFFQYFCELSLRLFGPGELSRVLCFRDVHGNTVCHYAMVPALLNALSGFPLINEVVSLSAFVDTQRFSPECVQLVNEDKLSPIQRVLERLGDETDVDVDDLVRAERERIVRQVMVAFPVKAADGEEMKSEWKLVDIVFENPTSVISSDHVLSEVNVDPRVQGLAANLRNSEGVLVESLSLGKSLHVESSVTLTDPRRIIAETPPLFTCSYAEDSDIVSPRRELLIRRRTVRILTIDGGGIRGIVPLTVLAQLEHMTGVPVYRMFDIIGGTSTGGLLTILLGLMRISIPDAAGLYSTIGRKVFVSKVVSKMMSMVNEGARYPSDFSEEILKELAEEHLGSGTAIMGSFPPVFRGEKHNPRCFVVAARNRKAFLFRNYADIDDSPLSDVLSETSSMMEEDGSTSTEIYKAALATCAAPSYFKGVNIQGEWFVDGGLVANNPANVALLEVKRIPELRDLPIGCLVSLGTGRGKNPANAERPSMLELKDLLVSAATDGEEVHRHLAWQRKNIGDYFRFNPKGSGPQERMDDVKSIETLEERTIEYINRPKNVKKLEDIARRLMGWYPC